ncbi:MAG TPA: FAD-dependent oxidoreductase, partial [Candidatus Polarisedimenticolia bacterium]
RQSPQGGTTLLSRIAAAVEQIRQLKFRREVKPDVLTDEQLSARVEQQFRKDNPRAEVDQDDAVLTALGLLGPRDDLYDILLGVQREQVAGYYDTDKKVLVVGGGDTAMEEATFLTKFASKVTVIHRRDKLRASKIMQDKAFKNPKIAFIWDSAVEEVSGGETVTGVRLRNLKTGAVTDLACTGLFIAIGHEPNTKLFKGKLEMDPVGYLKVQPNCTKTSVPGVFAAGDVADSRYRQAVTAAGTGCMAALDAERFLESGE